MPEEPTQDKNRISVGTGLDRLLNNLKGSSSTNSLSVHTQATSRKDQPQSAGSDIKTYAADDTFYSDEAISPTSKTLPSAPRPSGPRSANFTDPFSPSAKRNSSFTMPSNVQSPSPVRPISTFPPLSPTLSPRVSAFPPSSSKLIPSAMSTRSSSPISVGRPSTPPIPGIKGLGMTTSQINDLARKRMSMGVMGAEANARPDTVLISRPTAAELNEIPMVTLPGFTPLNESANFLSPNAAARINDDLEGGALTRKRSMTRPERDPRQSRHTLSGAADSKPEKKAEQDFSRFYREKWTLWTVFARAVTFYAPSFLLSFCGMRNVAIQEAWREKMALVTILILMCGLLGFLTFGFQYIACGMGVVNRFSFKVINPNVVNIRGDLYDISKFSHPGNVQLSSVAGMDVSWLFPLYPQMLPSGKSACAAVPGIKDVQISCTVDNSNGVGHCHSMDEYGQMLSQLNIIGEQSYQWSDIEGSKRYMLYNGYVLDLDRYFKEGNQFLGDSDFDKILVSNLGRDATLQFYRDSNLQLKMNCLLERFKVGVIDQDRAGCVASQVFTYLSLLVILSVIIIKFCVAVFFNWTISHKLGKVLPPPPTSEDDNSVLSRVGATPYNPPGSQSGNRGSILLPSKSRYSHQYNSHSNSNRNSNRYSTFAGSQFANVPGKSALSRRPSLLPENIAGIDPSGILRTIMLVTAYSEGESGLRTTLDSLARTTFPDTHKMLFIIADGIITGSGNSKSTPEILIDMIEMDPQFEYPPKPYSYVAIAEGSKRHNMAKVYAGRYHVEGHSVPTILVVKCGSEAEQGKPKIGNRGKRDSQIILMSFLSKCLFDDRMSSLEFDLFTKMTAVSSCDNDLSMDLVQNRVTPDRYELVLMVDADTKVQSDALTAMSWTMANDSRISGLCGETRIANKSASWVTMIQVFEYHISHFLAKSFESVFGCCTCLPGCFCMYRIKAPKGPVSADGTQFYVPILANPDIVEQYSESVVDTLHKKNLLLLGEDRYLTTLMLKAFPKRKMMFVPRAVCKTVVPDTFAVLLSQRRRWINSTVHNLLELVLIKDLCGIFCFSMQFVIFMELVGTAVLPAAITFTFYLIVVSFLIQPIPIIPLVLLGLILGLPAILILMTSKRWVYVLWMAIYMVSLPIWNFVLPVYAYWHFDDFSWGETRKVEGTEADSGHGDKEGVFDSSKITMKQWSEWEKERRREGALSRLNGTNRRISVDGATGNIAPPRMQDKTKDMSKSWAPASLMEIDEE